MPAGFLEKAVCVAHRAAHLLRDVTRGDMPGLHLAFQDFWRENANMNRAPFEFNEAYPHIVLQAFLQRVLNGGGEIIREMALGKGALDLGVLYHGAKYAVEVKLRYLWDRSPEKALEHCAFGQRPSPERHFDIVTP